MTFVKLASWHKCTSWGPGGVLPMLAAVLTGCAPSASFDSPDSTARLKAIQDAGASGDRASIPRLIEMLDSDDPAVRVMSIGVLEDMTGQDLGFDPYAEAPRRREAVERWEAWYRSNAVPQADRNANSGATGACAGPVFESWGVASRRNTYGDRGLPGGGGGVA
jgi:hypothetical protein